jgi:hypothetical protein
MDVDMQHEHGRAAWTLACIIDMDMQYGNINVALTWKNSMIANTWEQNENEILKPNKRERNQNNYCFFSLRNETKIWKQNEEKKVKKLFHVFR